jgi:hypothetical protein
MGGVVLVLGLWHRYLLQNLNHIERYIQRTLYGLKLWRTQNLHLAAPLPRLEPLKRFHLTLLGGRCAWGSVEVCRVNVHVVKINKMCRGEADLGWARAWRRGDCGGGDAHVFSPLQTLLHILIKGYAEIFK